MLHIDFAVSCPGLRESAEVISDYQSKRQIVKMSNDRHDMLLPNNFVAGNRKGRFKRYDVVIVKPTGSDTATYKVHS